MADSSTLRSRRARLHARDDHSLCRHGDDLAAEVAAAWLAAVPAPGSLVEAADALPDPPDAPGRVRVELARSLARRLDVTRDTRAVAAVGGVLDAVLSKLEASASSTAARPSRLAEMRAARAASDARQGWL